MSNPHHWDRQNLPSQTFPPVYHHPLDSINTTAAVYEHQPFSWNHHQHRTTQSFLVRPRNFTPTMDLQVPPEPNIPNREMMTMSHADTRMDAKENRDPHQPSNKRSHEDLHQKTASEDLHVATSEDLYLPAANTINSSASSHKGLDLLCAATEQVSDERKARMEIFIPQSCSCPKSKCLKLYCECFQAGTLCLSGCSCKDCKNRSAESGVDGARTLAVQHILSRNPLAFSSKRDKPKNKPEGVACRCTKTQCLKLYCDCFLKGLICDPKNCLCIQCLNTEAESGTDGQRTAARNSCLERNPDAFLMKPKAIGSGCSCKNSRCLKKYCFCFSSGTTCNQMCSCQQCANQNLTSMRNQIKVTQKSETSS